MSVQAEQADFNKEGQLTKFEVFDGAHAEIIFDNPDKPVNVLSRQCCEELHDHFAILKSKKEIKTLILRSEKPSIFVAGADIHEIYQMKSKDEARKLVEALQDLLNELDELPQTTVAMIHGACLGGGLELALACDYRVCSNDKKTQLGLPEVKLGVIPGAGGTQRLPRVVPLDEAIKMITGGASVVPAKAKKIGLVSDVMPAETLLEITRRKLRAGDFKKYTRKESFKEKLIEFGPMRKMVFSKARKQILEVSKGNYPAPLKAVDVIEETFGGPLKAGLLVEAQAFAELAVGAVSKNLIHLFFATEELKKDKGVPAQELGAFRAAKVEKLAIVGAGIMGGGIAAVAAKKGIDVRIKDVNTQSIATAMKTAYSLFEKDLRRRKISQAEFQKNVYRLSSSTGWKGYRDRDFVIEAVIENRDVKKQVFQELEKLVDDKTILATNTSSLSVSEIAAACAKPERVVGMHFFNPVPKMPLVEVIRAEKTSAETLAQTVAFGKQLGKTVIVVKDSPGFLVNRVLMPFLIECGHLKAEGFSIKQIDKAATSFGMPMGPFRLLDEIGLDTAAKVADVIAAGFPHMKVLPMIHDMVSKGYLGKKNGKGFYEYDERGKEKELRSEFQKAPLDPGAATNKSLQDRLILPMVTEAVMALEERVVASARDLDMGLIFGIGFPPFYGGLLKWVSAMGEREILDRMNVVHNATKGRLLVPEPLKSRVQNGEAYYPPL